MILFWAVCAVLILIALAFVLPPLMQRSERVDVKSVDERREVVEKVPARAGSE